jgi:hypothetical protein
MDLLRGDHPDLEGLIPVEERNRNKHYGVVGVYFVDDRSKDVVDTLRELQSNVRALIEEFKPAFKLPGDVVQD